MLVAVNLEKTGADGRVESERLKRLTLKEATGELKANLHKFTEEVLQDNPVSSSYPYWFRNEKLYTSPSCSGEFLASTQITDDERGGTTKKGFLKLEKQLNLLKDMDSRNVALWYSPKGKAAFDDNPTNPFKNITYEDGQLYIQYFDGEKVMASAVKINHEEKIFEILQVFGLKIPASKEEKDIINHYLLNPIITNFDIDNLLHHIEKVQIPTTPIYKDKGDIIYTLESILRSVRNSFAINHTDEDSAINSLVESYIQNPRFKWTQKAVEEIYLRTILSHAQRKGIDVVSLAGSCGGKTISTQDILGFLGISGMPEIFNRESLNPRNFLGTHSSGRRLIENTNNNDLKKVTCPHCGETVVFNGRRAIENDYLECTNCHKGTNCVEPIVQAARDA